MCQPQRETVEHSGPTSPHTDTDGIVPRMMVSPPERDLSIELFGQASRIPDLHVSDRYDRIVLARLPRRFGRRAGVGGDRSSLHVIDVLAGADGRCHQADGKNAELLSTVLPADRELAASFLGRAKAAGYTSFGDDGRLLDPCSRLAISNVETSRSSGGFVCRMTAPMRISPSTLRNHRMRIRLPRLRTTRRSSPIRCRGTISIGSDPRPICRSR